MASRILLADDSITIQKVVNLTFADEGIEVVAVSNGDLAERRLAEVNPDLVLADIFMPGKNGYELCEAIKENPQFRNVPVVLLVGAFEPFDQAEARRVKADAHLTKPFESRTLVETVRRLISASWRTTTGPIAPMPAADNGHGDGLDSHSPGIPSTPGAPSLASKLDLSAMVATSIPPSTPRARNTGELASPSPAASSDVSSFGIVDTPTPEAVSATLTQPSEQFEPPESSSNNESSPVEVAQSFDLQLGDPNSNEEIQAFDASDPIEMSSVQSPSVFENVATSSLNDLDISGSGEGDHWFNTGGLEAARTDRSSGGVGWRAPNNGSPLSYQSPDFALHTGTGYSASEAATETACATMLAVDEPLGDVLFDESASVESLAPNEMPLSDSLGLDFSEPEGTVAEIAPSTQFDLVEIVETSTAETMPAADEKNAVEHFSAEALEDVMSDAVENAAVHETLAHEDVLESSAATPTLDTQPFSQEVAGDLDWTTPRASSYSTAQLDSVVMPIDTAKYLDENSPREEAPQAGDIEEAAFTMPTAWTEEETRFTPIDIEAVAVEDNLFEERSPLMTARINDTTAAEQPVASSETFVVESAEAANESPAAPLSSAAIEEIVRRVVAEMSESVVREIAWEVVPDCVERVIEQLTRESLSKRA